MESLPTELLLSIFQYLDSKDLTSVAYVNRHWQEVVKRKCFWVNKVFVPPVHMSTKKLKRFLKTVPNLKHVRIDYPFDITSFVMDLCKFCKEIETFYSKTMQCVLEETTVQELLKTFPQAKQIEALVRGRIFLIDYAKFCSKSYSQQRMHINIVEDLDDRSRWHELEEYPPNMISVEAFKSLVEVEKENTLYMYLHGQLSCEIFSLVGKCKNLKLLFLEIRVGCIDFDFLEHLKDLKELETFQMYLGHISQPTTTSPVILNFPKLVKLEIFAYSVRGRDHFLSALLSSSPALKYLRIVSLRLSERDFEAISNCRYLETIAITCHDDFRNTHIQHIANNCPRLKNIEVNGCRFMTEKIIDFLSICPDIEEIGLGYFRISIPYLHKIPVLFPNIKVLDLTHSTISKRELQKFQRDYRNLKIAKWA